MTCRECGEPFVQAPVGRKRLYCSDACRREFNTPKGTCETCGAGTRGSLGQPETTPTHCKHCTGPAISARMTETWAERREEIAELYRSGMTLTGMAERLGTSLNTVAVDLARMRGYGMDIPHRRTPEQLERMRAGRRVAASDRKERDV